MAELVTNPNIKRKAVTSALAIGLAGLALSGCSEEEYDSNAQFRTEASVAVRYGFDYLGHYPYRVNKDGDSVSCLADSPYRLSRVVVAQEGSDGVKVTPGSKKFDILHFSGLDDYDEPLQPADLYTTTILEDYGCDTSRDGSLNPWN